MADDEKRPDQETEQGDDEASVDQDALADEWAAALAEQEDSAGGEAEDPDALLAQAQSNSHESDAANAAAKGTGGRSKAAAGERERKHKPDPNAQPMEPDELTDSGGADDEDVNLDMVLDVPVTISMEIGRTRIPIRNLLQLNQGSVVELERLAGEPLDVLVNGTLIAHGEVVVVNEKFGIRLTDVISPSERIRKLK